MWGGARLIRCSHADAAESLFGAGGGGVRRRDAEEGWWGWAGQGSLLQLASKVKGRGGGCSDPYRWVEGGGASGVLIPGTTVDKETRTVLWNAILERSKVVRRKV